MSVYKEGFNAVKELNEASYQVYPDAADYGVPMKVGDRNWILLKQLTEWYGVEGTRKVDTYSTGTTATQDVELMFEGEYRRGQSIKFRVTYIASRSGIKNNHGEWNGYAYIEEIPSNIHCIPIGYQKQLRRMEFFKCI